MPICYNPFSLEGKIILVTGASSGIGRGIAIECSRMGAKIVAVGRNETTLKETLAKLDGTNHCYLVCDLTDEQAVDRIIPKVPALNGIVYAAGVGQRILCRNIVKEDIDVVMNTNFASVVLLQSKLQQSKKIPKGTSIVIITSIAPESPSVGNAMYSASKGALVAYAKCLSTELASRQVRVNCISPAMVWTDLIFKGGLTKEELLADEKKYPLQRYGTPEDIAYLTIYLLSETSTWMTGSNLRITGGIF